MSVKVEDLGKNMVKLTITVGADKVDAAIKKAFNRQKNQINIPGFRKGKVPQNVVERMYGPSVFYEEAVDLLLKDEYLPAVEESGVDVVSQPTISIVQIEKGKEFIFAAEVAKRPEVKLGQYKGVEVTKQNTEVTEEDINKEIERQLNANAREVSVTDRPVADKDIAVIDYEGFVDGVAFEGGKDEGHSLTIGSHSFIDTFEEQIIGHNVGDEFDVNVTFPAEYHAADLAGKPAVFKVKVNEIKCKEVPELTDELVSNISEFENVKEYTEDIKARLIRIKEDEAKYAMQDEAVKAIAAAAEIEIPDAMIEFQADNMIEEFARNIQRQGIPFEQYLQYTGGSVDSLREQMKPEAEDRIRSSLVLEQIKAEEKIEATDADIETEIDNICKLYMMDKEEYTKDLTDADRDAMKSNAEMNKVLDFIVANAKQVEKKEEEKPKKAAAKKTTKKAEAADGEEKPKRTRKTTKKEEAADTEA
ncbi:MAG: trigger factor [Lachnospiraceae bacterium]|nr:trigger factor [Lachnospiraceae bacterium]